MLRSFCNPGLVGRLSIAIAVGAPSVAHTQEPTRTPPPTTTLQTPGPPALGAADNPPGVSSAHSLRRSIVEPSGAAHPAKESASAISVTPLEASSANQVEALAIATKAQPRSDSSVGVTDIDMGSSGAPTSSSAPGTRGPEGREPVATGKETGTDSSWASQIQLSGFMALWLNAGRDFDTPLEPDSNVVRIRFARLMVKSPLSDHFGTKLQLGFDNRNPLFDVQGTWKRYSFLNVSAGQFRLPFGASLMQPASGPAMWDRPRYVYAMTKEGIRDVGVMLHSGKGGTVGGWLEYALAGFNGNGRALSGRPAERRPAADHLYVARLALNPGVAFLPTKGRLTIGASIARSVDPSLVNADGTPDESSSAFYLGSELTPFDQDRTTRLLGGELVFSAYDVWLHMEAMGLRSRPDSGQARSGIGYSIEAGYRFSAINTQLVARIETLDPDIDVSDNEVDETGVGLNCFVLPKLELSAYGIYSRYEAERTNAELRIKTIARF